MTFDLEKPFMPFQQLLAVLPAASMELLPDAYRVIHSCPNAHTHTHVWVSLGTRETFFSEAAKQQITNVWFYAIFKHEIIKTTYCF